MRPKGNFPAYVFRELQVGDFPRVLELWRSCEGVGLNESDTPEGIARFLARNPGLSTAVETREHEIVGSVLCGHDGRRGYLHHLAVAAPHRHRGIGRALVESSLRRLHEVGIAKCNIFLYADNAAGRAFWLRQKWQARTDLVVVQRALDPSLA